MGDRKTRMVVTVIHETPQVQIKKSSRKDLNDIRMEQKQQVAHDKYKGVPKQAIQLGEQYEEHFTNHLLKEIQKSSGRKLGSTEAVYNSWLNEERAKMMAQSDTGLGIKDVVIDEVMRKISPNSRRNQFIQPQNKQVEMHNKRAELQSNENKVEMYKKINSQKGERL